MHDKSSSSHPQGRVQALDLLRLFAALAVVTYHYTFRGYAGDGLTHAHIDALIPVTKYGYFGVQLFFVISGFVIAYSAADRTTTEFAIARAARLYPGFIVCMTLTFAATLLFGMPPFATSAKQWLANLLMVSPAVGQPFMDGSYWSIVYELVFYAWMAVFIAAGLFPRWLREVVLVWLILTLLNMMFFHSAVMGQLLITNSSGYFIAGILLYEIRFGHADRSAWLLLATATVLSADQSMQNADWGRAHFHTAFSDPVIAVLSVGCIAIVALAIVPKRIPLSVGLVAALGGLTYPLYLLHQQIGFILLNEAEALAPATTLIPGVVVTMLCLALLVWRYIERPGQKLLKAWLVTGTNFVFDSLGTSKAARQPLARRPA